MSRFNKSIKPKHLNLNYNLYDAVRFEDNRTALITGYGIYDNQYWCEVCYPDGVHLGAADYFLSNSESYGIKIIGKLFDGKRQHILKEYIKALEQYPELYNSHIDEILTMIDYDSLAERNFGYGF